MNNTGKKFINNLINYVSALWAGVFTEIILSIVVSLIFNNEPLAQSIGRAVCGVVGSVITLSIMSYRDGYKDHFYKISTTVCILLIIFIAQQVLAPLNGYKAATAGAAEDIAIAIFLKGNTDNGVVPTVGNAVCLAALQVLVYAPTVLICEYRGYKQRRSELRPE